MKPNNSNTIALIPARAGSKGVPQKNSKSFANGKSLVERAIEIALTYFPKNKIILSTDDQELLTQGDAFGINLINREPHLASDTAGMLEVMLDAIDKQENQPEYLLLLQPTSPFRTAKNIEDAFELFQENDDAIVAVNEPAGHPFYTLFQEENGYISKFQKNQVVRRQDLPPMYDVNGLLYLFKISELKKHSWVECEKIRPLIIPKWQALDIDTEEDWWLAELIQRGIDSSL
ncbi:cytidylyltransferase domain-containing protein [Fluviicola taffensis]|uniref:N-acylneuraminate cytidylyltransferase n=1 Tax=Fluviicola taffensis (strain DSM 16823 / NCIMB 13979 / RW262) TaxID=755732 RepID=F2IA08_FLUTR|nr:acylneuraminate cytidylyltransferase family protein [Fluviicola taffensis]AEA44166.1 N-acylneuraminate cytidylyltransferase [Fluviicola taffensis DSM 16823]